MTQHGQVSLSSELKEIANRTPHLSDYLEKTKEETGEYPILVDEENVGEYETQYPNIIYNVDEDGLVFIHIYGERGNPTDYTIVEPTVEDKDTYEYVRDRLVKIASNYPAPESDDVDVMKDHIRDLIDKVVVNSDDSNLRDKVEKRLGQKVEVSEDKYERIRYNLVRDVAGINELQPVMDDSYNEDIHIIGHDECHVDHGVFGMLNTNVDFGDENKFERFLKNLGERINNPMSDSDPIIDSTLPDGSRLNVVYSTDVSVQGSSMTIRQGEEVPLSILQITKWGTLSPKMAAYLWLCLENERTVFVVGETASGKTTTLNAILSFIENDSKIYTAEDTAEVLPPQDAWQQLLTRETPDEESTDVSMFNLVEAALRSRPDYIVVGEVRGPEAQMAFQAAQTGHPVLLTFHAEDVESMVQRFTSNPINVPKPFMPIADVALFQNRVKRDDGEVLRRVTSVSEIVSYNEERDGIATQEVFGWNPSTDEHTFKGQNSSVVLENDIANLLGYEDNQKIYDELERRTAIIERLIENNVLEYEEVNNTIDTIQSDGVESLNIDTSGLTKQ